MAVTSEKLERSLNLLIEQASLLLFSPKEISDQLGELSNGTFADRARLTVSFLGEDFSWGADADAAGTVEVISEDLAEGLSVRLRCAARPKTAQESVCIPVFTKLARTLWGSELRGKGGVELSRQFVHGQMANSVARLAQKAGANQVIVVFADLDHFGALNKQAGQENGDRAIRFVNAKFHELCRTFGGLPFHQSGDEFLLVLPDAGLLSTLKGLRGLRRDIRERAFIGSDHREHRVDLTLGMSRLPADSTFEQIDAARGAAEATAKRRTTSGELEKRRGKVCFPSSGNATANMCSPTALASFGAVLVRRRLVQEAFGDPRLNLVASVAEGATTLSQSSIDTAALKVEVDEVLGWLDVVQSTDCSTSSLLEADPPITISKVSIGIAVAQGVLRALERAGEQRAVDLFYGESGLEVGLTDGADLVWGERPEQASSVRIGEVGFPDPGRCFIGVQYGLGNGLSTGDGNSVPMDIFDKVILVDERPKIGGGLPDFWQVVIAEVCRASAALNAEPHVFVWGKGADSSETYRRLRSGNEWSIDEVVALTGVPSESVRALNLALASNTRFCNDAEAVIAALLGLVSCPAADTLSDRMESESEPALRRDMLAREPLSATDGLRCRTASEAYPLVLDVLRKGTSRQSVDDADQRLNELLAFRLVLETPTQSVVPSYFRQQEADMERYANEVLLSSQGKIGSLLWESGQIDAMAGHLASYFAESGSTRCTRRACLVVPNTVSDGHLRPLGLISVWATPRANPAEREFVDYVFVWRTVEAFVGFPFSLYGSIRLAQRLLELVSERLPTGTTRTKLRVGSLIYVALSLHMRVDDVHQRIAKRIVDAASD